MRLDIKTVKGKDYVQLVDDLGYIHHIGAANPKNLGLVLYVIGFYDIWKWSNWLKAYYVKKGKDVDSETVISEISDIEVLYKDGLMGMTPRASPFGSEQELSELSRKIIDRIEMFEKRHYEVATDLHEFFGVEQSKTKFRKVLQRIVRANGLNPAHI